jgi:hypothetical protein
MDGQRKITPAQWAAVAALWALAIYGMAKPAERAQLTGRASFEARCAGASG